MSGSTAVRRLLPLVVLGLGMSLHSAVSAEPGHGSSARTHAPAPPRIFAPGAVSTDAEEYRITFTPNGRTAYFARSSVFFPFSRQASIMETHLRRGEWSTPTVAEFSGQFPDLDPYLTRDGRSLYFSSIRPIEGEARDDADIFRTDRRPDGSWGPVEHVAGTGGTNAAGEQVDDLYPTPERGGSVLFGSNRDGGEGGFDLWREGEGRAAENLGATVNSDLWEYNPTLAPDRRTLVFTRLDPSSGLGGDLYAARRTTRDWAPAQPLLGEVNTEADEYHASFSPDGRRLFFVRRDLTAEANGDLYSVSARGTMPRRRH